MGRPGQRDEIPEEFRSAEEAGEFWDTHSAADYSDQMIKSEIQFDIRRVSVLVAVSDRVYRLAEKRARERHIPVEQVIDGALEHELATR